MAVRTSAEKVRGIIETDDGFDLTPFIATANHLVNAKCTKSKYTDTELELIERWLAAHFLAIFDMRSAQESAGSVSQSFQFKVDLNLHVTIYGQQAMLVDYKGNLAALNKRITDGTAAPSVTWLGKKESEFLSDTDE